MGAGYRILSLWVLDLFACPPSEITEVVQAVAISPPSARWNPGGLPWYWWLCAGFSSYAIGALDLQLFPALPRLGWFRALEGEGWTLSPSVDEDDFPEKEEYIKKPWLQMSRRTSLRVTAGELLDPYLDWVRMVSDHYLPGVAGSRYPRFNLKYPTFVSYLIRTVATCNPPIDVSRTWSIGRVGVKDEPAGTAIHDAGYDVSASVASIAQMGVSGVEVYPSGWNVSSNEAPYGGKRD